MWVNNVSFRTKYWLFVISHRYTLSGHKHFVNSIVKPWQLKIKSLWIYRSVLLPVIGKLTVQKYNNLKQINILKLLKMYIDKNFVKKCNYPITEWKI